MYSSTYYFSDPVTPIMWGIVSLHDHILFFLVCILFVVLFTFFNILVHFAYYKENKFLSEEGIKNYKLLIKERMGRNINLYLHYFSEETVKPEFVRGEWTMSMQMKIWQWTVFSYIKLMSNYLNEVYAKSMTKIKMQSGNSKYTWSFLRHGMSLEIIWTLIPSYILLLIAVPSFALLFAIDEAYDASLVVKIMGHQWYWSYETEVLLNPYVTINSDEADWWDQFIKYMVNHSSFCSKASVGRLESHWWPRFRWEPGYYEIHNLFYWDFLFTEPCIAYANYSYFNPNCLNLSIATMNDSYTHSFDSYMIPESDLVNSELRLLKTDNALILPQNVPITLIMTSEDVLHSWSVQRFGIKVDAVPGSLSQATLLVQIGGKYYGQCSELCGVNHGFMPIEVWVIDLDLYQEIMG